MFCLFIIIFNKANNYILIRHTIQILTQEAHKMDKKQNYVILIFVLIVVGILIWGVIGGFAAKDAGVTCDMGVGNAFCWKWHTNALGQVGEFLNNLRS